MAFSRVTVQRFLVQHLGVSNKVVAEMVAAGRVLVNGLEVDVKHYLEKTDELVLDCNVIKSKERLVYLLYHKPRGVECTLNPDIADNLTLYLDFPERVFPVGRLDKDSEGLLLLTNDGNVYNQIADSESGQEKEYEVEVDLTITPQFIHQMANGIVIMGKMTLPTQVWPVGEKRFGIVLRQGLNRQIRRMCHKLGYKVTRLVRTRIVNFKLGDLPLGKWREISDLEMRDLKTMI
jgi:23S rRNA pseudouridine2604 synthase